MKHKCTTPKTSLQTLKTRLQEPEPIYINGHHFKRLYIKMIYLMAQGKPDKMIAHELGRSQGTFDFHKSKIYKILNVQCKAEAVSEAYKHHILCAK
jgi:DNA-binding NarL/FixJ family response regulator